MLLPASSKHSPPNFQAFDEWNEEKKKIHKKEEVRFIKEREVWYIALGQNIWNESNGKQLFLRPALVLKKVWNMFFVAPMTTKGRDSIFYHTLGHIHYIPELPIPAVSRVQLSQAKIIDKRRFSQHIATVPKEEFESIKKKLRAMLL
jgi:mRNA-degrading endonuclease toxin of MazEF toxin-antitoxin module